MRSCDERFRKNEHILKTKDFAALYKKGRRIKKDPVILYVLPNSLSHSRIGFSIGSRSIKLSTKRNRIRRLLREAFRKRKKELKPGYDLVFVVRRDMAKPIFYNDVEAFFLELMKEANLLLR